MMSVTLTRQYASPLGRIILASDGDALTGLWFSDQKNAPRLAMDSAKKPLPVFQAAEAWLDVYFGGGIPSAAPPLRPEGTAFQRAVWELLLNVPYGQTTTYGAIAARLARRMGLPRMSAQAVGGAAARNPICLMIPCHRLIGADGRLTGYAGGIERKKQLLRLEQGEDRAWPPQSAEDHAVRR